MPRHLFCICLCTFSLIVVVPSWAQQTVEIAEDSLTLVQPANSTDAGSFDQYDAYGECDSCTAPLCICGTSAHCNSSCGSCSCCNDIWHRDQLFGDWLGVRSGLAQRGVIADIQWTQFYQGVTGGGNSQTSAYGGKFDYNLTFLGEQMGLNEGLIVSLHAESRYGNDIINEAAPLAISNANMLYPSLDSGTAITQLQIIQMLNPDWALTFGKFNAIDLVQSLYPQTGRGVEGFMNMSIVLPMTTGRTLPLAFLGAGVMKMHGKQIEGTFLVYDSNDITTTAGFDVLFDNGANLLGLWRVFTDYGGLPGSHLFLGTYAHGTFTSLDPTGWGFFPSVGVVPAEEQGSWNFNYILEQKLWIDCCNKNRSIGFLGQFGIADGKTNPFQWSMNTAVQAQGLVHGRDQDTMGIGCFYSGLSDEFKSLLSAGSVSIDDLYGGEIYYNAALTPWFHLTGDLQIIHPGIAAIDTTVVAGLRANIKF